MRLVLGLLLLIVMGNTQEIQYLGSRQARTTESPENISRLHSVMVLMDFQHIVDWNNAHSEKHQELKDLSDEQFTTLMGYLVQSGSFMYSRRLSQILPDLKDEVLIEFLKQMIEQLNGWSLHALEGQETYHLVGYWGTKRRQLLHYLGFPQNKE